MPIIDSPYTDPDIIQALESDPANEQLIAEILMNTGAGAAALLNALGQSAAGGGGGVSVGAVGGLGDAGTISGDTGGDHDRFGEQGIVPQVQ